MKRNYHGVVNRIKEIALAHPVIQSADEGRELEFDTTKKNVWPRFFIRTDSSTIAGAQGSVELAVTFTVLCMDRLNTKRSNSLDVLGEMHGVLTDVMSVLNKEQLTRTTDTVQLIPMQDYQDTQTSGWSAALKVYLDTGYQCYPVENS